MAKPTFILEQNQGGSQFKVSGDLGVQYAKDLKAFLLQALDQSGSVNVEFDNTTSFDLASAQISHALKKEIQKQNRSITFSLPKNESVLDLLNKTGITKIL